MSDLFAAYVRVQRPDGMGPTENPMCCTLRSEEVVCDEAAPPSSMCRVLCGPMIGVYSELRKPFWLKLLIHRL